MRISDWSSDVCSSDLWIAAIAARLDGRPARINIDIMNCGTPVSRDAAAPPGMMSGDQPKVRRRVLIASNAQTRSEEHTSELQSLMRISYAVFCLKKNNK